MKDFSTNKDDFYPNMNLIYSYFFSLWGIKFFLNPSLVDSPEKIGKSLPGHVSVDDFSNYLGVDLRVGRDSIKGLWKNFSCAAPISKERVINWIYDRVYN